MDPHRLAELRSLALHAHVAKALLEDSSIRSTARERIHAWRSAGTMDERVAARWLALLDEATPTLAERLVADDEAMCDLRQSTPFTFVVSPRERWAIWRSVAAEAAGHATP